LADSTHSWCKLLYFLLNGEERPTLAIPQILGEGNYVLEIAIPRLGSGRRLSTADSSDEGNTEIDKRSKQTESTG
jgi:hypothetical protein